MPVTRKLFLRSFGAGLAAFAARGSAATSPARDRRIPARSVIPAALTPFMADLQIDRREFRRHLEALAGVRGVTAIMVNGAAGEDAALSRDERRTLVAEAVAAVGDRTPVIAAVRELRGDPNLGALAKDAAAEGAHALMIMPPPNKDDFGWEGARRRCHQVFEAANLPVAVYHTAYATETLVQLAGFPAVFAIKEGGGDPAALALNLRALRAARADIAIWSTNSRWLLADLAVGADGILSGMGSVTADWHVALVEAVGRSDLAAARKVNERMLPLVAAFYRPGQNPHARMKYALACLGRLPSAQVRPPLKPLDEAERRIVEHALREPRLLP
jgi:4-hydroxy-tetrahydrodipicolinate synthase